MAYQHLPITTRSGTDSDCRHSQPLRDERCYPRRHRFQHNGKAPGLLQREGIIQQRPRRGGTTPLRAVSPQLMHRLRRQPDVPHHGDASAHNRAHGGGQFTPAFELHAVHARFGQKAPGVAHRLGHIRLIGEKGHVAGQERPLRAARHSTAMVQHFIHRHR